jgi:hypothetical protein
LRLPLFCARRCVGATHGSSPKSPDSAVGFRDASRGTARLLCLAAGSLTYRISRSASVADLRVKIDPQASNPDLRAQLVDDVASADFALVDDTSAAPAAACARSGLNKIVRITTDPGPADLTVALSSEPADAPLRLYVHSAWFGPEHAAALYAAMRHFEQAGLPSATDAESQDAGW